MKNSKEYFDAECKAREESIGYPFKSEFESGFDFATSQPKHIFDGVAKAGEVRRYDGELVVVVIKSAKSCTSCIFSDSVNIRNCMYLTGCDINNVKYIKQ